MDKVGIVIKDFPEVSTIEIDRKRQLVNRARLVGLNETNTQDEVIMAEAQAKVKKAKEAIAEAERQVLNIENALVVNKRIILADEAVIKKAQLKLASSISNVEDGKSQFKDAEKEVLRVRALYAQAQHELQVLEDARNPKVVVPVLPLKKTRKRRVVKHDVVKHYPR